METQRSAFTATRPTVLVHRQAIYTPQLDVMAYLLACQHRVPEPGGEPAFHTLARGLLTSVLDPNNHTVVSNVYDPASGRVTHQTDANGKPTDFTWDAASGTSYRTDFAARFFAAITVSPPFLAIYTAPPG